MPKKEPALEMMAELSNPISLLPHIPYFKMPFFKIEILWVLCYAVCRKCQGKSNKRVNVVELTVYRKCTRGTVFCYTNKR